MDLGKILNQLVLGLLLRQGRTLKLNTINIYNIYLKIFILSSSILI